MDDIKEMEEGIRALTSMVEGLAATVLMLTRGVQALQAGVDGHQKALELLKEGYDALSAKAMQRVQ